MIEHDSLCEKAYQRLLTEIIQGQRLAGEKLGEVKLAEEYGISRTPAREAMQRLIQEGLIEQRPRCGCYVRRITQEEMVDVFQCRQMLECMALRLGYPNWDKNILQNILDLLRNSDCSTLEKGMALSLEADDAMHASILSACGNRNLMMLIEKIQIKTQPFRKHRTLSMTELRDINQERALLVKAMMEADLPLAEKLLQEHILHGIPHEF